MDSHTTRRKPGRPLRFPARVLVYVTTDAKAGLEAVAKATDRTVPEVVRAYIRAGLDADKADQ